ncbi:MAG: SAM-dependent methyltransferase, partial [Bacteroidota bacterium]|nr:SAM-dependent methyltransferase [Bacteroidota bacterium]
MNNTLQIVIFWLTIFLGCNSARHDKPLKIQTKKTYTFGKASTDGIGKFYLGREISQVMGSGGAAWLERDSRQQEENAALAIKNMNLSKESVVAD